MRTRSVKSITELSCCFCSNPKSLSVSIRLSFPRQFDYDSFFEVALRIGISLTCRCFLRSVRRIRASTLARGARRRVRQRRHRPPEAASDVGAPFDGFWLFIACFPSFDSALNGQREIRAVSISDSPIRPPEVLEIRRDVVPVAARPHNRALYGK